MRYQFDIMGSDGQIWYKTKNQSTEMIWTQKSKFTNILDQIMDFNIIIVSFEVGEESILSIVCNDKQIVPFHLQPSITTFCQPFPGINYWFTPRLPADFFQEIYEFLIESKRDLKGVHQSKSIKTLSNRIQ